MHINVLHNEEPNLILLLLLTCRNERDTSLGGQSTALRASIS